MGCIFVVVVLCWVLSIVEVKGCSECADSSGSFIIFMTPMNNVLQIFWW